MPDPFGAIFANSDRNIWSRWANQMKDLRRFEAVLTVFSASIFSAGRRSKRMLWHLLSLHQWLCLGFLSSALFF